VGRAEDVEVDVRFRTWPVAAIGLGSLLILIVVSMLTLSGKAQDIYTDLDQLSMHHNNVDIKLRRLRSDVNLSEIFVRDYVLDVARDHAPEYQECSEPGRRRDGLGLRGFEERVKELNSEMTVSSIPGAGTTLSIQLPLPVAEREALLARAAG
jgi:signal transduction histidine kinase